MPLRSRRMVLESLEARELLSVSPTLAEVSVLAKPKPFKEAGSLTGTVTSPFLGHPFSTIVATGDVGTLGSVQFQGSRPARANAQFAFTLTSAQGTMTFTSKYTNSNHGYTLKLKQGTGAYARWTGTGTLTLALPPGYVPVASAEQPAIVSLKLTLKA